MYHYFYNENKKLYECQECDFVTPDTDEIQNHYAIVHFAAKDESKDSGISLFAEYREQGALQPPPEDQHDIWTEQFFKEEEFMDFLEEDDGGFLEPKIEIEDAPVENYFSVQPTTAAEFRYLENSDIPFPEVSKNYNFKLMAVKVNNKFSTEYLDAAVDLKDLNNLPADEALIIFSQVLQNIVHRLWRFDDSMNTYRNRFILLNNDPGAGSQISTAFMDSPDLAMQNLLVRCEQVLNSNEQFLANNGFRVHVIRQLVNSKGGGGARASGANRGIGSLGHYFNRAEDDLLKWLKLKRSVISVPDNDGLCLIYALLLGQVSVKAQASGQKSRFQRHIQSKQMRNEALLVCQECQLIPGPMDTNYLEILQNSPRFCEFKITVYNLRSNCDIYYENKTILDTGKNRINIGIADNHFFLLLSLQAILDKMVCHRCGANIRSDRMPNHKCPMGCPFCAKTECPNKQWMSDLSFVCDECYFVFRTGDCLAIHRVTGDCAKFIKCKFCGKKVARRFMAADGQHNECNQIRCFTCKVIFDNSLPHFCYVQPYVPKEKIARKPTNKSKTDPANAEYLAEKYSISTAAPIDCINDVDDDDEDPVFTVKERSELNLAIQGLRQKGALPTGSRISRAEFAKPKMMTDEILKLATQAQTRLEEKISDNEEEFGVCLSDDECPDDLKTKRKKSASCSDSNSAADEYEFWYYDIETVTQETYGELFPILVVLMNQHEQSWIFTGLRCIEKMLKFLVFDLNQMTKEDISKSLKTFGYDEDSNVDPPVENELYQQLEKFSIDSSFDYGNRKRKASGKRVPTKQNRILIAHT